MDVVTAEIVKNVHDMIFADCRTKVREVAEAVNVSYRTVINILHDKLGMRKLMMDNKQIRLTTWKQCLSLFKRNPQEFLCRLVTADETWIHYYTTETKRKSKK